MTAFICKPWRSEVITKPSEFAISGKLITCFLGKFAQRDLLNGFIGLAIDLPRRHFPNGPANRNSLLPDEHDFPLWRDWRDNDGSFAVDRGPRSRF